jgi:hypothetical protein
VKRAPAAGALAPICAAVVAMALAAPTAAATERPEIAVGTYTPDTYRDPGLIDTFARQTGRPPVIVNSYKDWDTPPFNPDELNAAWDRGAVPMVTWEPMTSDGVGIPLRRIAAKGEDGHIFAAAREAAAWGKPIFVRFAHEMNGDWFPWGFGVGGNTATDFRKAWRRVVGVSRAAGADNIRWVWCPNEHANRFPLEPFYPGDSTVDWLCLDGFNFGERVEWPSFTSLFGNSYNRLVEFTNRPLMIGETGAVEEGGEKAEWIASALGREAPRFDRLRAIVWWNVNDDKHGDFRVNSSRSSLRAVRDALADPVYGATRSDLLSIPASLPDSALAPKQPDDGYGAPPSVNNDGVVLLALGGGALIAGALGVMFMAWRSRRSGA